MYVVVGAVSINMQEHAVIAGFDATTGALIGQTIHQRTGMDLRYTSITGSGSTLFITGCETNTPQTTINTVIVRVLNFSGVFALDAAVAHQNPVTNLLIGVEIFQYAPEGDLLVYTLNMDATHRPEVIRTDYNGSNGCEFPTSIEEVLVSPNVEAMYPDIGFIAYTTRLPTGFYQTNVYVDEYCSASSMQETGQVSTGKTSPQYELVSVYPVPAGNQLHINLGSLTAEKLELQDMLGRTVLNVSVPENQPQFSLPVHEIPEGVYLLNIRNADGTVIFTQKVSINR